MNPWNLTAQVENQAEQLTTGQIALNNSRGFHCIVATEDLCRLGILLAVVLRKGCLFLICTKVPYGLVVVLEMNLGKGQEHNFKDMPAL